MTTTHSPTVAVRFALIICSVAVLFDMWLSLTNLVSPASGQSVSRSDGSRQDQSGPKPPMRKGEKTGAERAASEGPQGDPNVKAAPVKARVDQLEKDLKKAEREKDAAVATVDRLKKAVDDAKAAQEKAELEKAKATTSPVASLLLLVLGVVVILICVIAAMLVWDLKKALQAAEQKASSEEDSTRKANTWVEELTRQLCEAQQAKIHAESEQSAAEDKWKKARNSLQEAAEAKAKYERKATEIQDNWTAAKAERAIADQLMKKATDAEQDIRNRENECQRRESECQALVADVERREDLARAEQAQANDKVAAANETLRNAQNQREEAAASRNAAAATLSETVLAKTTLETLRSKLWPTWVAAGAVKPKIDEIESLACGGNANGAILLSYLQVLRAIENHPDINREFNYLWPTVREIGRSLAAMLADSGSSPQESAERLTEWAKALNQQSRCLFTIAVPTLQSSFNSAQMESKNGNILTVSRVNNWSVSNAKSIMASKAEVS